jgi:hypothetical protein
MRNIAFLLPFVSVSLAWPQAAPPPAAPAAQSTAAMPMKVKPRGPEAVAETDPSRVVATINGKQITAKEAAEMLKPFPPDQRKQYESNLPKLLQELYMREQLADAATKMNLDQQTPWKEQVALSRENVLAQAYLSKLSEDAAKATTVDPQKYYTDHPDEFDQVNLSAIFVAFAPPGTPAGNAQVSPKTEQQASDKANDIEKKLKAGGDFAAIARTDSDNQGSGSKGGVLGTFNMGDTQIPPELRTVIGKLQPGQISEPVRVGGAFLIVRLDGRKKVPFEEAQASIIQKMKTEKSQTAAKQELDKYKIKVDDPDFFEAAGGRPMPSLQRPVSAPTPPKPQ